jgi:exopolysaccharide biosynthesis polyprenyl glycosylphosphotransferase
MLKEEKQLVHKIAIVADSVVIGAAFLLAYFLRANIQGYPSAIFESLHKLPPLWDYLWMILIVIPIWITSLSQIGVYKEIREKSFGNILWNIFDASLLAILIFSAFAFLLKLDVQSRTFIIILFICTFLMLSAEKIVALASLRYIRRKGYNYRVILIVGSGERAKKFISIIKSHPHWGFRILGLVDEEDRVGMTVEDHRVIGSFNDIARILDENVVDEVMFILPRRWLSSLEDYLKICEEVGVKATVAMDFFNTDIARPVVTEIHGLPLLTFNAVPYNIWHLAVKRLTDVVVSACGLILLSPLFLTVSLMIKMTSKGPVFFRQTRCGLNGRGFTIYKFRTMAVDAEKRLSELMEFNEREGPVFKIQNDPRITRIGSVLRKTSLDELPQLLNVLKGDMSLIGPRPPLPAEVKRYDRWQRRRLSLRPGIACIHEVVARRDKDFEGWIRLDLEYIDNWSLSLDARILTKTILTVFRGNGC